jgi:hypothetical protein
MRTHLVVGLYGYWLGYYADGRPEGSNYIIIAWLRELYLAIVQVDQARFWKLIDLHSIWKKDGKLSFSAPNHAITTGHAQYLKDDYALSVGEEPSHDNVYKHKSAKQRKAEAKANSTKGVEAAMDAEAKATTVAEK